MAVAIRTLYDQIESHLRGQGFYDRVAMHEPKASPGRGLTAATWFQSVTPVQRVSGLDQTSARVELVVRILQNFIAEPQDLIDPVTYEAADDLIATISADYTLGGNVMQVDLLGAYGVGLSTRAGYLNQQGDLYRIMDVTVPLIIDNAWSQTP